MSAPAEIADGLWRWTAPHPGWRRAGWGAEVASYAAVAGEHTLLIDPLLPGRPADVFELIEGLPGKLLAIIVTIVYHGRSSEAIRDRFAGERQVSIHGPAGLAKRMRTTTGFEPLEPGQDLPGGARAYAIGTAGSSERPIHLPAHRALAFGDALVGTSEGLRVWAQKEITESRARWYRDRFAPTATPLLDLDVERILVSHGPPVLSGGTARLREALEAPPWFHPG